MYTALVMIAQHGMDGNPEMVKAYMQHFINVHEHKEGTMEGQLSRKFKQLLGLENPPTGLVTLDESKLSNNT